MELSSRAMLAVERSLDGLSKRQEAIASNLANANTPGYVAKEVPFEEALLEAMAAGAPPGGVAGDGGFANDFSVSGEVDGLMVGPRVGSAGVTGSHNDPLLSWMPEMQRRSDVQRLDGNGVSIEVAMSQLTRNAGKFGALTAIIGKEFQLLKTVAQAK